MGCRNLKRIYLMGGTGYIGSNFQNLYNKKVEVVPRGELPPTGAEIVIYMISTTSNYNVFEDPNLDIDTNLVALSNFFNWWRTSERTRLVFVSSWFVYGQSSLPANEEHPLNPKGFYSITKMTAERLIQSFAETFDLGYVIVRLSNVIGGYDPTASSKKNALHFLLGQLKKNCDISLYWGGQFIRDYIDVRDACKGLMLITESPDLKHKCYNLGSGIPYNFIEIITVAQEILKSKSKVLSIEQSRFHEIVQVKDFYMNISRVQAIGFDTSISINQSIEEICQKI
nr:SDR family oxidoreductase [Rhodospirillales bacterium]